MAEKETWMILHVDLQCPSCYKKIKKILCKFPQIRDQVYDKPKNLVKITVVGCSPEKIRDKLCCKGGKVIKSIDIVPKDTPKPSPHPRKKPIPVASPPLVPEAGPEAEPEVEPEVEPDGDNNNGYIPPPDPDPDPPREPPRPKAPVPVPVIPVLVGFCCPQCYEGHGGGPCYFGYGRSVPPPPCYDNYYSGYGYNKGWYVSRCDDYFSEENTSACRIM